MVRAPRANPKRRRVGECMLYDRGAKNMLLEDRQDTRQPSYNNRQLDIWSGCPY